MLDGRWAARHPDHRPRPAAQCLPAQLQTSQRFVACRDSLLFEDKNLNFLGKPSFKQELKALLDPEISIIATFLEIFYHKKSENSELCLMALDLLLHVLVLHHVMQFRNFYLVFLSISQCQGFAPCYAILE